MSPRHFEQQCLYFVIQIARRRIYLQDILAVSSILAVYTCSGHLLGLGDGALSSEAVVEE